MTCFAARFLVLAFPLTLMAAAPSGPAGDTRCAANPAARQLDYWIGDWSVGPPGAPAQGHSKVYLSLDQCLLVESWGSDTSRHAGENAIAFSAEDNAWHGLFVDNQGRVHALAGTMTGQGAALAGPSRDADGKAILKRVRVVRVDAGHVDQIWEKSVDEGAAWVTEYRMQYSRKNP